MTYSQIYEHLLEIVRKEVSVYHRYLGNAMDGFYDVEYDHIVICSKLKGTKRGVRALAHEWKHRCDRKAKKFTGFFTIFKKKYSEKLMAEVIAAEQSAGLGAERTLKEYGKKYKCEEMNPKKLPGLIKFWRGYYLDK